MDSYGKELILDLHDCNPEQFIRPTIIAFFQHLCERIDMQQEDWHFWDDVNVPIEEREIEPHLKGTSGVQFIKTSNITIHTLDLLKAVYLNIFSCKNFDVEVVKEIALKYFSGKIVTEVVVARR